MLKKYDQITNLQIMQHKIKRQFRQNSFIKDIQWINQNSPRRHDIKREAPSWSPRQNSSEKLN